LVACSTPKVTVDKQANVYVPNSGPNLGVKVVAVQLPRIESSMYVERPLQKPIKQELAETRELLEAELLDKENTYLLVEKKATLITNKDGEQKVVVSATPAKYSTTLNETKTKQKSSLTQDSSKPKPQKNKVSKSSKANEKKTIDNLKATNVVQDQSKKETRSRQRARLKPLSTPKTSATKKMQVSKPTSKSLNFSKKTAVKKRDINKSRPRPSYRELKALPYTVQVSSVKLETQRNNMLKKISKALLEAGLDHLSLAYREKQVKGSKYFRITIGHFSTKDEARAVLDSLEPYLLNPGRVTYLTREERKTLTFE
jgi:hypothetical protein